MIPDIIFQRVASHYFYRHMTEKLYLELEQLLIDNYMDEDNEPLDDDMVEMVINFLDEIFYE